ncbi:hypothetical protein GWI33_009034 [Rhynchophorus ferrugineus]|uniref:Uncharacterized protein n=1 Tax=Rhynchophorus ferrugineus TaxID=354439 RepID=A0A834IQ04_RHYFE|nr:hypothetical protein GWI33_009034 [Rhynchophorus ferrugineus]
MADGRDDDSFGISVSLARSPISSLMPEDLVPLCGYLWHHYRRCRALFLRLAPYLDPMGTSPRRNLSHVGVRVGLRMR